MKRYLVTFALGTALAALVGLVAAHRDAQALNERAAPPSKLLALVPAYPDSMRFGLGGEVTVNDRARTLSYSLTAHAPPEVVDYYAALWQTQGFVVDRKDGTNVSQVSARAPADPYLRTVVITRAEVGTIIIGSSSAVVAKQRAPLVPTPGLCERESATSSDDAGIAREVASFACRATLDEVLTHLGASLGGAVTTDLRTPDTALVTLRGPRTEALVSARLLSSEPPVTRVVVSYEVGP